MATFLVLTLALLLVGGVMFVAVGLLVSLVYNLLAPLAGGLEVELQRRGGEGE